MNDCGDYNKYRNERYLRTDKKDVIVLWGGTKDVGRNETRDGLQQRQHL